MQLIEMRAIRPLSGDYGRKAPGERFVTDDRTAMRLASKGAAEYYFPPLPRFEVAPRIQEERKIIVPQQQPEPVNTPKRRGRPRK